jgi:hypothetical protein
MGKGEKGKGRRGKGEVRGKGGRGVWDRVISK